MKFGAEAVFASILEIAERVRVGQMEAIREAGGRLAERLLQGGVIHVFGAGHSRAFGMEMCGRAGGLAPMKLVGLEDIAALDRSGAINLVELERDPDTAHRLLELHDVRPEDAFVVVSNSGRNGAPVELALECARRGIPVVAVTSLDHSGQTDSRHPSGKRLFEIADVVIDNGCPYGDVLLDVPGLDVKTGSASSVVGALIAQALTADIIERFTESGRTPPVYVSANVDGGDEHNKKITEQYAHRRITY
ncbi:sugar isomerase domain-containing protein [Paenibacillus flagellatus]|uniref:Sugar isomerase n=1 Tax=Paenibacillus flagellatus TaxID=2211139 RepID=A0A2V5K836_9BACL|nr:SIS domain-containing protein [Paenibacillus flagellatus]PYI55655.1 sugar isomerase [Paenibacillus flagellatus]